MNSAAERGASDGHLHDQMHASSLRSRRLGVPVVGAVAPDIDGNRRSDVLSEDASAGTDRRDQDRARCSEVDREIGVELFVAHPRRAARSEHGSRTSHELGACSRAPPHRRRAVVCTARWRVKTDLRSAPCSAASCRDRAGTRRACWGAAARGKRSRSGSGVAASPERAPHRYEYRAPPGDHLRRWSSRAPDPRRRWAE